MGPFQLLAAALALLIGVILGGLGSGGSITTLPMLVYVAGVDPRTAVAMSLIIVGAASAVGMLMHWRRGNFDPKTAFVFGVSGVPGALIGAEFTHLVPPAALMLGFSLLLLVVGFLMFHGSATAAAPGPCRLTRCASIGVLVGVLTGFLGVGGGFMIVPALVLFAGLEAKAAVGTSLGIIAVNSAAGIARQVRFVTLDWTFTLIILAAVLLGMFAGVAVLRRVRSEQLTGVFAGGLVAIGVVIGGVQVFELL